jgi:alpha-L-arabinofuranosidase
MSGDPAWTDYTIHLRARKLSGNEGFIVLWHAADSADYHWWNIGGWNNTIARCEGTENGQRNAYGPSTPFLVEPGRWYELRLEVTGRRMRGFIDGKLVTEAVDESHAVPSSAIATATYDTQSHTVLVRVVNIGNDPLDMAIRLKDVGKVNPQGTAMVLAGDPDAVNTVDQPTRIAPKQEAITDASTSFHRKFPPHSFTLLRLTVAPR